MLEIKKAKYISGFTLWLSFNDGTEGTVNLKKSLWGPVFEPLKNIEKFVLLFISSPLVKFQAVHTVVFRDQALIAKNPDYFYDTN